MTEKPLILEKLDLDFSICKLPDISDVDLSRDFTFLSKTDEEISFVCPAGLTPQNSIAVETGWNALRVDGVLDFSMVGLLARISGILAKENISSFVISTYNTDYFFLKFHDFERSVSLLTKNGYTINQQKNSLK